MKKKHQNTIRNSQSKLILSVICILFSSLLLAQQPEAIIDTREELERAEKEPNTTSTDDLSKELSNPNTPLAKLKFETTTTFYKGTLPGASSQVMNTTLFQPVFPFPLTNDGTFNLFVRPAFPFVIGQSVYDGNTQTFNSTSGFADMGYDMALGRTFKNGMIIVVGAQGTIPTGTDENLTGEQWRMGPELILAYINKKGLLGIFPAHQWNIGGRNHETFSTSSTELFAGLFLPNSWVLQFNPLITYNWQYEQWDVPINAKIQKVVKFGKTPLQVSLDVDYFVESNDEFGKDWAFTLTITPVVQNFIYNWIKN